MDIAQKLSWEFVALNDRGISDERDRLALEIAYGIALKISEPAQFRTVMASVTCSVTDPVLRARLASIGLRHSK